MPFTIGGEWIPSRAQSGSNTNTAKGSQKRVLVRLVKRGKNILTVILHLPKTEKELNALASSIKKKLGCGGAVQETAIEIQGDKVSEVKKILEELSIKSF